MTFVLILTRERYFKQLSKQRRVKSSSGSMKPLCIYKRVYFDESTIAFWEALQIECPRVCWSKAHLNVDMCDVRFRFALNVYIPNFHIISRSHDGVPLSWQVAARKPEGTRDLFVSQRWLRCRFNLWLNKTQAQKLNAGISEGSKCVLAGIVDRVPYFIPYPRTFYQIQEPKVYFALVNPWSFQAQLILYICKCTVMLGHCGIDNGHNVQVDRWGCYVNHNSKTGWSDPVRRPSQTHASLDLSFFEPYLLCHVGHAAIRRFD